MWNAINLLLQGASSVKNFKRISGSDWPCSEGWRQKNVAAMETFLAINSSEREDQTFEFDLYLERRSVEMKAIGAMDSL